MSGRGLLVLLALFAAAVAIVVFVDRQPPEEEKKSETLGSLVPVVLDAVDALERARGEGRLRLERTADKGWRLSHPIEAEADPRQVKSLFEAAVLARIQRVVEEKASDMKRYGLDPPDTLLRVFPAKGQAVLEIAVGRSSPVGSGRYVATGDGRVLLAEGLAVGALEQDADSFLEKRLFPVESGEIRRITLDRAAGRLALVRDGSDWRLEEPVADAADSSSVDTLARSLADLSFSRFVEDRDLAKARASLERAAVRAGLEATSSERRLQAALGSTGPGEDRYACREEVRRCGVVAGSVLRELERPPDDYRDRRLLPTPAEEIREVRVQHAGGDLRVFRTQAGERGTTWSVQEGIGPVLEADSQKVDGFLDRLRWLRASAFDRSGAAPRLDERVVLVGEKGEMGRLELARDPHEVAGEGGAPPQKLLYARSSWRAGVLFAIPSDGIGALPRSSADLAPDTPAGGSSGKAP